MSFLVPTVAKPVPLLEAMGGWIKTCNNSARFSIMSGRLAAQG